MATMGRLMKNLDMDDVSLSIHRSLPHRSLLINPWLLLGKAWDLRARRCAFFEPLHYDSVARIQAARDDPSVIDPVSHGDGSNVDFVLGTDDSHLVAAL